MDIAIVVYDGFDNLDGIGPFEVFSHAKAADADLNVGLYTLAEQDIVETSHGLRLQPDGVVPPSPDLVAVPGGGWSTEKEASARGEADRGTLPNRLRELHEEGTVLASVCTGAMLLAAADITTGRPATTHHTALSELRESGATLVDARVVDDGDVLTAGGVTAGIDLALYLLQREFGPELAQTVSRTMEYELTDEIVRRETTEKRETNESE